MKDMELDQSSGVWFTKGTPEAVKRALVSLRIHQRRARVFLGDATTGKDWNEENDVTGYIGTSGGEKPIMLLVNNRRSMGGGALLTHCIVKIINIATGETVYQHPTYHTALFAAAEGSDMPEYAAEVWKIDDGNRTLYARCKSYESAYRLAAFMNGKRHNK